MTTTPGPTVRSRRRRTGPIGATLPANASSPSTMPTSSTNSPATHTCSTRATPVGGRSNGCPRRPSSPWGNTSATGVGLTPTYRPSHGRTSTESPNKHGNQLRSEYWATRPLRRIATQYELGPTRINSQRRRPKGSKFRSRYGVNFGKLLTPGCGSSGVMRIRLSARGDNGAG